MIRIRTSAPGPLSPTFLLAAALLLPGAPARAQSKAAGPMEFQIDPVHSAFQFKVRHIISMVPGQFRKVSGTISYDAAAPASLQAQVTIDAASLDTGNQKRDDHLRSADFFEVEKYPTIEFRSTKAEAVGEGKLRLTGDLTMKGITKPVTLDLTVLGVAPGFGGTTLLALEGQGKLNRKDFNILWNRTLDDGNTVIGDEVQLLIQIEAGHAPPADKAKS
jgi:polyisoprenoid-binding protein YceI